MTGAESRGPRIHPATCVAACQGAGRHREPVALLQRCAGVVELESYCFTTFAGVRPAEPCSVTVLAMHQVLTNLLLYLMYSTRHALEEASCMQSTLCARGCSDLAQQLEVLQGRYFQPRPPEAIVSDCLYA